MTPEHWKKYEEAKAACPESLLVYQLGDYYECFGDDAEFAARVLGLPITRCKQSIMAGFPRFHLEDYTRQLVAAGRRVAIASPA